MGRRFGLAWDNAVSFDFVTADGRLLRANDQENPDLYWGLRGGGGNFGVVSAIEYRLHDMDPTILGGIISWPLSQARDVLRFYRDIALDTPEVLNLDPELYTGPEGPVVELEACWSGDHAQGEAWLTKLRTFGKPRRDDIGPRPYKAIQAGADELLAPGQYYYLKSGMLTQLKDGGIEESTAKMRENYGANFERLVAFNAKYDPNNLFRLNANVPPKIG